MSVSHITQNNPNDVENEEEKMGWRRWGGEGNAHLLKSWLQTATMRRHGCSGGRISSASSLEVGIQKARRPASTRVAAEKASMSSSMARKL